MTESFRLDFGILNEFWRFSLFPLLFHPDISNISIFFITWNAARTLNFEFWQSYEMMLNQLWGQKLCQSDHRCCNSSIVFGNSNSRLFLHSNANCMFVHIQIFDDLMIWRSDDLTIWWFDDLIILVWWYDDMMIWWSNKIHDLLKRKYSWQIWCSRFDTWAEKPPRASNVASWKKPCWSSFEVLLMAKILHQLIGSLSHYSFFTWFYTSQPVQDFFHQQQHFRNGKNTSEPWNEGMREWGNGMPLFFSGWDVFQEWPSTFNARSVDVKKQVASLDLRRVRRSPDVM